MKILTGRQIREADRATIESEGISPVDLMERAAEQMARWIADHVNPDRRLVFCCGKGGNGGDGLAVARILADSGRNCTVLSGAIPGELSEEAHINSLRLPEKVEVLDITVERPDIEPNAVIIDALLGVGVTGSVREPVRGIVEWINRLPNDVISIDIPSGMPTEWDPRECACDARGVAPDRTDLIDRASGGVVCAGTTLAVEFPKLAMLQPDTGHCAGEIVVLPIGLDEKFISSVATPYYYITPQWVERLRKKRAKFSHKGSYGHALVVCGSATMPGAAILAIGGALRSGCGLVTAHIPENERFALTANHPSAMLSLDDDVCFATPPTNLERFSAIGVGCGLGRDPRTVEALRRMLMAVSGDVSGKITMVLDADALNRVAENADMRRLVPAGSVLTPHPGELRRLIGEWRTDMEKLEKASKLAAETASIVIVKGAHSAICTPDGRFIFNSTGTPGMAKGGSGDVLTGFITGLVARGYDAETASVIGVYTHGRAGEEAARSRGEEAMNASDIADFL